MSPVSRGFRGRSRAPAGEEDRVPPAQIACHLPWTSSWTGAPDSPSAPSAIRAIIRIICAGSAHASQGRTSCNWLVGALPASRLSSAEQSERGTVRGTARQIIPALRVPSVR